MYKTLSLEAMVYADSDDKYSSIFQNLRQKKKRIIIKYRCYIFTSVWSLVPERKREGEKEKKKGDGIVYLCSVKVSRY